MSTAEKITTIKHLPFNGKQERWRPWKRKFLTVANRKGFKKLMIGDVKIKTDAEIQALASNLQTDATEANDKLKAYNELGMEELLLSMDDSTPDGLVVFNLIDTATTMEFPDGLLPLAWSKLRTKFEPTETGDRLKWRDKFHSKELKSIKVDPEVFMTGVRLTQQGWIQAGGSCTDDDVLEQVMNNMPDEYESIYTANWKRIRDTTNPYTVDELTRDLKRIHDRKSKRSGGSKQSGDDGGETAFFAGGQFKGRCNKCGKYGHKGADCRSKGNNDGGNNNNNENNGSRFKGKCFECGKVGHRKADCWHNPKNKNKQLNDRANVALDDSSDDELAFFCVDNGAEALNTPTEECFVCVSKHVSQGCCTTESSCDDSTSEGEEDIVVLRPVGRAASPLMVGDYPLEGTDDEDWVVFDDEAASISTDALSDSSYFVGDFELFFEMEESSLTDVESGREGEEDSESAVTEQTESTADLRTGLSSAELQVAMALNMMDDIAFVMVPAGEQEQIEGNLWVGDTGASCHMKNNLDGMFEGVDFTESYIPVVNDITWRILIVLMIILKLEAKIVDIETAFLYGEFEDGEEIYMDCPPGLDHNESECLRLLKTIYGLVQASRQYFKKFTKVLRGMGFTGGDVDPCLMYKESKLGRVYIGIYVDDCLLVGDTAAIEDAIAGLKQAGFTLKESGELDDYLSCEVRFNEDRTKAWLGQPHMIKKIEKAFGGKVSSLAKYGTPGTPRRTIFKEEKTVVDKETESTYRSGVGQLLYLVKHSRPDIANAVRELSKALDGINELSVKEMYRVIKFVLDTKGLGLKIEPIVKDGKIEWKMVAFSDSDYATDPETRISISGFVLYFMGVPISWRSKAQKSVTLSSAEAEFVAISECAKEIRFVQQLLETMGIKVDLPITVRVDNIGAIFMSNNVAISQKTKHIDTRVKWFVELVVDNVLKIIFVRSEDNDADLWTKNVTKDLYETHSNKIVWNTEDLAMMGIDVDRISYMEVGYGYDTI